MLHACAQLQSSNVQSVEWLCKIIQNSVFRIWGVQGDLRKLHTSSHENTREASCPDERVVMRNMSGARETFSAYRKLVRSWRVVACRLPRFRIQHHIDTYAVDTYNR